MAVLFLLFFLCIFDQNSAKSYQGYHVINSKNGDQLLERIGFEEDYAEDRIRSLRSDQSSILVHPSLVDVTLKRLTKAGVDFVIVTEDLQKNIDEERKPPSSTTGDWFESYHSFGEILQWLKMKSVKHSKHCSLHDIGKSYHKRPLRVIKIVGEPNQCKNKPSIWIDSGIHAREWISHSTGLYLIERLLEDYQSDPFVKYMRNTYDWYFLVVINPDGYEYSWTDNRMWRKSRSPNKGVSCIGTDINRNFDHKWMTIGASSNPCSETYAGPTPFSESEGKAVADFVTKNKNKWDLFVTLHSYGHLWLSPWGYTTQLPDNYPQMEKVGMAAVSAIQNFSGIHYRFGSSANVLYSSSGTSRDWAKGVPKIPLVYTVELRNGSSFVLPPSEIIPTGIEIWRALKACIKTMETVLPPSCKLSRAPFETISTKNVDASDQETYEY